MWFAGPAKRVPEAGRPGALRLGFRLERGMKVGLLGGSFNPAHEGHAHVAETALAKLGLDAVIWLVSPQNPLKSRHETEPLEQRMASARRQARGPVGRPLRRGIHRAHPALRPDLVGGVEAEPAAGPQVARPAADEDQRAGRGTGIGDVGGKPSRRHKRPDR